MLIVESAAAILNLIAGTSEICIYSFEILTAGCRVVGIKLLAAASPLLRKLARL
jgi:hypothetical protein